MKEIMEMIPKNGKKTLFSNEKMEGVSGNKITLGGGIVGLTKKREKPTEKKIVRKKEKGNKRKDAKRGFDFFR